MSIHKKGDAELRRQYPIYFQLGLAFSLIFLIAAFRVDYRPDRDFNIPESDQPLIGIREIPQTEQPKKPPPPRPQVLIEKPDDVILEDEVFAFDAGPDIVEPVDVAQPPDLNENKDKERSEPFLNVEEMPELIGGMASLQRSMTYPEMAKRAGVEGKVFIQFVVDENGDVVDPVVLRGIGGGCDEEALRAVGNAKFTPGRQRGRPVRVKMSLPVIFKLR